MDFYQKLLTDLKQEYEPKDTIRALLVTGSVARNEAYKGNDVDILLVTTGETISKEYYVEDALVELGTINLHSALESMQTHPMYTYMYVDAKALFDKDQCLEILQKRAQEILNSYKPSVKEKQEIKKWLSSVVDKVIVAKKNDDKLKVGFHVSNVLWMTVKGVYTINSLPIPAATSALRRIQTLKLLPENFEELWNKTLLGDFDERSDGTIEIMKFVLEHLI